MLTLTKSLFALMIGFILATALGLFAIPLLKKIKAGQRINVYVEAHQRKSPPQHGDSAIPDHHVHFWKMEHPRFQTALPVDALPER